MKCRKKALIVQAVHLRAVLLPYCEFLPLCSHRMHEKAHCFPFSVAASKRLRRYRANSSPDVVRAHGRARTHDGHFNLNTAMGHGIVWTAVYFPKVKGCGTTGSVWFQLFYASNVVRAQPRELCV